MGLIVGLLCYDGLGSGLLTVPRVKAEHGEAFIVYAPHIWNELKGNISFKSGINTILFPTAGTWDCLFTAFSSTVIFILWFHLPYCILACFGPLFYLVIHFR